MLKEEELEKEELDKEELEKEGLEREVLLRRKSRYFRNLIILAGMQIRTAARVRLCLQKISLKPEVCLLLLFLC